MNLLTIEHLSKNYTERMLFDDTDLAINEGDKVALIGVNGTGKSTLLRIAAGLEAPDEGSVIKRRDLYIRYLPQTPVFDPEETVLECIVRENTEHGHQNVQSWDLEVEAKTFLNKLGITDYHAKMGQLSGGQKKRTALCSVLLSDAELLILDEPTNHLDGDMCDWLEARLKAFRGAVLMVTHDRYFLDAVANRIVELDRGKCYSYQTNYEGYLSLRAERLDMANASERIRQSILRKELKWMMRGAKARSTKQKGRIQRFEELSAKEAPKEEAQFSFSSAASRLGRTTVELNNVTKAFGAHTVLRDFSYIFLKNDRIGIVGRNGAGKSTLLKLIAGELQPDSGQITIGQTVRIGYFSQENEHLPEQEKVIDYIREVGEYLHTPEGTVSASQFLERFLFTGAMQHSLIGKLSGGEKRRLYLMRILMGEPNFLMLDEPSNDLDIRTMTILEDYLDSFPGIVVTVSHDRYFLDRIVGRIFSVEEDGVVEQYEGGFTDFQKERARRHPELCLSEENVRPVREKTRTAGGTAGSKAAGAPDAGVNADGKSAEGGATEQPGSAGTSRAKRGPSERKRKFTYHEQRDWNSIEAEIDALEQRQTAIDAEMQTYANDFVRLQKLSQEREEVEEKLLEKMERWAFLSNLYDEINGK